MTGSSSDLDINFFDLLATVAAGTLVDDTLAGYSTPVFDLVMLLHHMRSSHGSLVFDCNVWASWDWLEMIIGLLNCIRIFIS